MSRLNKTGVTRKDVDGKYYLTLYGTVILHQNTWNRLHIPSYTIF